MAVPPTEGYVESQRPESRHWASSRKLVGVTRYPRTGRLLADLGATENEHGLEFLRTADLIRTIGAIIRTVALMAGRNRGSVPTGERWAAHFIGAIAAIVRAIDDSRSHVLFDARHQAWIRGLDYLLGEEPCHFL